MVVATAEDGGGEVERGERIAVFERTKMCKFHILGVCTKGDNCRFAHDRHELQTLPDLQRTKLCKTLISTGECNNPACRYAHNKEELRPMPAAPPQQQLSGQRQHQDATMHQAAFDSAMHAAILQVGQAAQAHAAKAVQLQALAAQLQTGTMPANAVQPFLAAATAFGGAPLDPQAFVEQYGQQPTYSPDPATHDLLLGLGDGSAVDGHPAWRSSASDDLSTDLASSVAAPGTQPSGSAPANWPSAMDRVLSNEPVQILPETLRSLSSSSLNLLAGNAADDDEEESRGSPKAAAKQRQGHPLRVLEKRSQDTPLTEDVRAAEAAAGADQPTGTRNTDGAGERDAAHEPAGSPEAEPPKTSSHKVASLEGRQPRDDEPALVADAEEDMRLRSMPMLVDTLSATGITVKNTFLDFAPREPVSRLRAVQTAAGRLDLMGQE